jgi:hypothetical protein
MEAAASMSTPLMFAPTHEKKTPPAVSLARFPLSVNLPSQVQNRLQKPVPGLQKVVSARLVALFRLLDIFLTLLVSECYGWRFWETPLGSLM